MDVSKLKESLILSEGLRLKAYKDTVGKVTIGVGRNLDDVGISREEAFLLLDNDIKRVEVDLQKVNGFLDLIDVRQHVIAEMVFNMGFSSVMKFKQMWAAIAVQEWHKAADAMLDSLWARQVGKRAERLAKHMRLGVEE